MERPRGTWSGLSEEGIICAASLQAISELLEVGDSIKVNEGGRHHQHMKNLMGMELERKGEDGGQRRMSNQNYVTLMSNISLL